MIKLKATNHDYYCSSTNYYVGGSDNHGRCEYVSWEQFKESWLDDGIKIDDDYNHCFRFDIIEKVNEDEMPLGVFELWLFFILQRKGIYRPVLIDQITESDIPEINEFLSARFEYLKGQWFEFSMEVDKCHR